MKNEFKFSFVRVATVIWVIAIVLTGFFLSVPPANVPIYFGLAGIGAIPLIFGSRLYKIFGIFAVTGSLMLAFLEHQSGLRIKRQKERLKQKMVSQQPVTNSPAIRVQKP